MNALGSAEYKGITRGLTAINLKLRHLAHTWEYHEYKLKRSEHNSRITMSERQHERETIEEMKQEIMEETAKLWEQKVGLLRQKEHLLRRYVELLDNIVLRSVPVAQ